MNFKHIFWDMCRNLLKILTDTLSETVQETFQKPFKKPHWNFLQKSFQKSFQKLFKNPFSETLFQETFQNPSYAKEVWSAQSAGQYRIEKNHRWSRIDHWETAWNSCQDRPFCIPKFVIYSMVLNVMLNLMVRWSYAHKYDMAITRWHTSWRISGPV